MVPFLNPECVLFDSLVMLCFAFAFAFLMFCLLGVPVCFVWAAMMLKGYVFARFAFVACVCVWCAFGMCMGRRGP